MWFDFTQAIPIDHFTTDSVRLSAFEDPFKAWQFFLMNGDDHLAAYLEIHVLLSTEFFKCLFPLSAVDRFQRPGCVIDSRVKHTRIMSGLVRRQRLLFFQNDQPLIWKSAQQVVGRCQADNTATNNGHLVTILHTPLTGMCAETVRFIKPVKPLCKTA